MTNEHAFVAICLFAAFADGAKDDREREHIREVAETLGMDSPELPRLYQDVLLGRIQLADVANALQDLGARQYAYEMAVCVCDADGSQNPAERRFLEELKSLLRLEQDPHAARVQQSADAVAAAVVVPASLPESLSSPAPDTKPTPSSPELDKTILNYAILNGALELLPQSWASVAIIPLQIKMVYRIGKAHGYELDQGHIREFLSTVGVGLTSQYLEQFGRKLIGGLLGKMGGKALGGIGKAATGVAFSFATTYALGQVARRYYAGGRQMSTEMLRTSFQEMLGSARGVQSQYAGEIRDKASTLDATRVMALMRGDTV